VEQDCRRSRSHCTYAQLTEFTGARSRAVRGGQWSQIPVASPVLYACARVRVGHVRATAARWIWRHPGEPMASGRPLISSPAGPLPSPHRSQSRRPLLGVLSICSSTTSPRGLSRHRVHPFLTARRRIGGARLGVSWPGPAGVVLTTPSIELVGLGWFVLEPTAFRASGGRWEHGHFWCSGHRGK
jgi:hypothetical protein